MNKSFRCVLIGGESLLIQCAELLKQRGHHVTAIVTTRAAVRQWATKQGIRVLREPQALLAASDLLPIDYLFSITNLQVLSAEVLKLPQVGAINFHDGPLPEYAGLNTPVWALLNGESSYGITWHRMTAEVDRGEILVQRRFDIADDETSLTINTKNYGAAVDGFETLLDGLANDTLKGTPQDRPIERYYGRKDRPAAMAALDWRGPAANVVRLVRALDFGTYANPVATAKASAGGVTLRILKASLAATQGATRTPGQVVAVDANGITAAASDADVVLQGFETLDGRALTPMEAAARWSAHVGSKLDVLDDAARERLSAIQLATAAHEGFWMRRLETRNDYELAYVDRKQLAADAAQQHADARHALSEEASGERRAMVTAAVITLLARLGDKDSFDLGYADAELAAVNQGAQGWMATRVPMRAEVDFSIGFDRLQQTVATEIEQLHKRGSFALDVVGRTPDLRAAAAAHGDPTRQAIAVAWVDSLDQAQAAPGSELTVAFNRAGTASRWFFNGNQLPARHVTALQSQLNTLLAAIQRDPRRNVGELPLLDDATLKQITVEWNRTDAPVRGDVGVHHLIEQQAARTPDKVAITAHGRSITYRELDTRANKLARRLVALGVKPDVLVGLMCERSVELIVGLLAIHKAGGAYVPLDPTYPRDRIAYMIEDARAPVLLTLDHLRGEVTVPSHTHVVAIDGEWASIDKESGSAFDGGAQPEHLAYVIYTSGSTGKPKGVMVEHRNAVNFFAGMDSHLGQDDDGTWLAVTSLSFDISVLELCWTLTRGFHVVISSDEDRSAASASLPHAQRSIDFSLFYFSANESGDPNDKYKLLLEGAKYGDQHGFTAVWTPERHFHEFGGLYPNPAVTGAAIAAVTKKVQIRGGSVVLPLHHPLRVAEEWSVVDNISHGRVGIAFASGWQPNDFVLMPQNYKGNKEVMTKNIEIVRKLWRGERHAFENPLGEMVETKIMPRPVQKELPYWVTSAGNIETFEIAGRIGARVLTHLLGQTLDELKVKLDAYRKAYKEAGHPGEGYVSLMLHTFVGPDEESVRAQVKQPLKDYLATAANLVQKYAWSFPAFKRREGMNTAVDAVDLSTVTPEEMDALLDFSFERYYEGSGLFGTPERALAMVDACKGIGVDDVACLIDFGVEPSAVLAHLPYLNQVRKMAKPPRASSPEFALHALMDKHPITHLQCTPSMARMLLLDDKAKPQLAKLRRMMVGGETLQPQLATELTELVQGKVMNMYGPTETTIWSAVHTLDKVDGPIPLGRPLANQQIYILDRRQQPLPVGVPGELVIGGKGVVRGYLHRPELTAEKFLPHPLAGTQAGRVYRTGDLARLRDDGMVEFLGRLDHQVKVRGYRIELGEIEAVLAKHPDVSETVVMAREDSPGDVRLVAYLVAKPQTTLSTGELKESLREHMPDFMVPAHYVVMDAFPQTPNGKIDRKQLPPPDTRVEAVEQAEFVEASGDLEQQIVEVWKTLLNLPKVGVRDNFFDLGGHSLLAIQVLRDLKVKLQRDIAITDIFRFPTVQSLAAHLSDGSAQGAAAKEGQDRAQGRRAAMARRAGARETTPT